MNRLLFDKAARVASRKADALLGRFLPLAPTLDAMSLRPFELHLELTNLCNANCIFCPYQFQERDVSFMPDEVFYKAVGDYAAIGGGSVGLTPIVGDPLIDREFLARVKYLRSLPSIDRIWVTTNAILLDKHGVADVLNSGLSSITISTSGFDRESYERVYRSKSYSRMLKNVRELLALNSEKEDPLTIVIGLRSDRPLEDILKDEDFREIQSYNPLIDFTWAYTSAGDRIKRESLPASMKLRSVSIRQKNEPCVQVYNGPIVLPDGTLLLCSCVAAMDATTDLGIGNILENDLLSIWRSPRVKELRASFGSPALNETCKKCDMYRNLELYRTSEGRKRAQLNRARNEGRLVKRSDAPKGPFSGG